MVHTGSMKITSTTFEANNAGKEGMAILSVGVLQEAINVTFIENTLHCPINQYGFDKDINEVMITSRSHSEGYLGFGGQHVCVFFWLPRSSTALLSPMFSIRCKKI